MWSNQNIVTVSWFILACSKLRIWICQISQPYSEKKCCCIIASGPHCNKTLAIFKIFDFFTSKAPSKIWFWIFLANKIFCFILHQHCSIVCPTWVTNNKWKLQFSVLKWLSMLNNCCLFCPMHINGSLKFKKIKSNPFIKYIWSKKSQFSPWNRQIICWEVFIFVLKMYYSTI